MMDTTAYQAQYSDWANKIERRLAALCDAYLPAQAQITQAARYSLLGGGKRVRGVLALASCVLCGTPAERALDYGCAVEMLHAYSLIQDDLPCMDDDDTRRGKPSCHKQFGECTALLASDALLTAAFEVIAHADLPAESRVKAAAALAAGGGARGMILGQELDMKYETVQADAEQLCTLHRHKTGALIMAAAAVGCAAAGADAPRCDALRQYAAELGLVFQIVDDVLDVTATTEELGKPSGSDAENDKTTFVTLYGLKGAQDLADEHNAAALAALQGFGSEADFLREMARELLVRKR